MVASNTFAELSVFPPLVVQVVVVLMIIAVVMGTLVDRQREGSTLKLIVDTKRKF